MLSPTAADEEETTYRRIVANKQVDAVYVSSPRPADRRITLLNQLGIPFIVHGRSEGLDFDYAFLDIDNEAAFHDATRLLVQLGHARVALINGDTSQTFAIFRERGVRRALAASGLALPPGRIRSVAMTEENGFRAAEGPDRGRGRADRDRLLQPDHGARRRARHPRPRPVDPRRRVADRA